MFYDNNRLLITRRAENNVSSLPRRKLNFTPNRVLKRTFPSFIFSTRPRVGRLAGPMNNAYTACACTCVFAKKKNSTKYDI